MTLAALGGMVGMQAVYWLVTYPVNQFWLRNTKLSAAGTGFFAFDPAGHSANEQADWTQLRDRWEYSHIARAALAFLSFLALAVAMVR